MFLLTHSLGQHPLILDFLNKSLGSLTLTCIEINILPLLFQSHELGVGFEKVLVLSLIRSQKPLFLFCFLLGIIGGLTSVITSTVEGVKTEGGVSGFISGLGKGLVGTVTKPVAGALDFASETAQAVRDTATLSGPRSVVMARVDLYF